MVYTKLRTSYRKTNAYKTKIKGQIYDSKFEGEYSLYLDSLVKKGEITSYDRQVKISLDVNGYHICNYFIDYVAYHKDGITEYIECKGIQMDVWKIKWRLFESLYGDKADVKITLIQQGNQYRIPKLRKVSS